MKLIRLLLASLSFYVLFVSCSKGDDGETDPECVTNNTTQVKFTNTSSMSLRVEVAYQLTPQYEAVSPVVSVDLAAGASVTKTFTAGRYMMIWKSGCPSSCTLATGALGRTFESCEEYEEASGSF